MSRIYVGLFHEHTLHFRVKQKYFFKNLSTCDTHSTLNKLWYFLLCDCFRLVEHAGNYLMILLPRLQLAKIAQHLLVPVCRVIYYFLRFWFLFLYLRVSRCFLFYKSGGIDLLVGIANYAPDSFVDDLFPSVKAFRPRFPCDSTFIPSAMSALSFESVSLLLIPAQPCIDICEVWII